MKHNIFSIFVPALLTAGLLASCSKINERLDGLDKRIDGLESERIATIDSQIESIESSIADLGIIRDNIRTLTSTAEAQGEDVTILKAADEALGQRMETLKTFVGDTLESYSKTEWMKATFSTLEQYRVTCKAIAKIDAGLESANEKLSKEIKDCVESLTIWINTKFGGYYTIAEMDARLENMQAQIDSAAAVSEARADSIAAELTKAKSDIASMITAVTAEYKAIIDSAINANEGKLTKALNDKLQAVEDRITPLNKRVADLEGAVDALYGRVSDLEAMIQSVTIDSDYGDGSVDVDGDTLLLNCIINPESIVSRLNKNNFTILLKSVKTKAVDGLEVIPVDSIKVFWKKNDTVFIKANIAKYLETSNELMVAARVTFRHNNKFTSSYTTDFVKADFLMLPPEMKRLFAGEEGCRVWKWDYDAPTGSCWGNGGAYDKGETYDIARTVGGHWWGVSTPEELLDQLSHAGEMETGGESRDAYMVFSEDGTVTSYDKTDNVIGSGTYEIRNYNPSRNSHGNVKWELGKLVVSDPLSILFPWSINEGGKSVKEYDIMYIDGGYMTLVNTKGHDPESYIDEITHWRFKSFNPDYNLSGPKGSKKWTWKSSGRFWGNTGYINDGERFVAMAKEETDIWWGIDNPQDFLGQLNHAVDGQATGGESRNACMVITNRGEITSYDGEGNVIAAGNYEIKDKNESRNYHPGIGGKWSLGKLEVSDPKCILWPFKINAGGEYVSSYDIMYIDDDQILLINNDPGRTWDNEVTFWRFEAVPDSE